MNTGSGPVALLGVQTLSLEFESAAILRGRLAENTDRLTNKQSSLESVLFVATMLVVESGF